MFTLPVGRGRNNPGAINHTPAVTPDSSTIPDLDLPRAIPSYVTRVILLLTRYISRPLPTELALFIISLADYCPSIVAQAPYRVTVSASSGRGRPHFGEKAVIVTPEVPEEARKVVKCRVWTNSRDQGFSGEARENRGTYRTSYTWFELAILRPGPDSTLRHRRRRSSAASNDSDDSTSPTPSSSSSAPVASSETPARSTTNGFSHGRINKLAYETNNHPGVDLTDPQVHNFPEPGWHLVSRPEHCLPSAFRPPPPDATGAAGGGSGGRLSEGTPPAQTFDEQEYVYARHRWPVQLNKCSHMMATDHVVEWVEGEKRPMGLMDYEEWEIESGKGWGEGFVEALRPGDRVVLLAEARYPAWVNNVYGARVELWYTTL